MFHVGENWILHGFFFNLIQGTWNLQQNYCFCSHVLNWLGTWYVVPATELLSL